MTISQMLLPEFEEEMKSTRKVLERIPEDKLDFRPHAKSSPMGQLAGHVAELASWAKNTMETDTLTIPEGYTPWKPTTRQEILDKFDQNVQDSRGYLQRATDEEFAKTWTLIWRGQTVLSMPRSAVFRSIVMNHLIHHRAQLGVYLRLNDIPVPGVYGPSADEM